MSQLPYGVTKEQLHGIFDCYNPKEIHLPMTAGKEHAKGTGRLIFEDERMAKRARVQMQGYIIDNMPIQLLLDSELKERKEVPYDVVMIKNLPYDITEDEIFKVLQPYQILRVGLPREPIKRNCLGYGFVRFASPGAAENAIESLKNLKIKGRRVRLHMAEVKEHNYRYIV